VPLTTRHHIHHAALTHHPHHAVSIINSTEARPISAPPSKAEIGSNAAMP
jgi:hypothetical protein